MIEKMTLLNMIQYLSNYFIKFPNLKSSIQKIHYQKFTILQ